MPGGRRSPQARALRELVHLRLAAEIDGALSLDEAIQRHAVMSRRSFLRASGLTGAGLALAACTSTRSPTTHASAGSDQPRIVIVGAGLAGLTTAYRLHQAGVAVAVHEARDRIGGRCWSSTGWAGGLVGEHGGEFIDTRHVHTRGLAAELGLTVDDLWSTWDSASTSLQWVDGQAVDHTQLFEPIRDASNLLVEQVKRNGSYLAGEASTAAIAFDQMTVGDWVSEATGQSLDSPMARLFSSDLAGWYGLDVDELGASNLIDYYAITWPGDDERYTIHGGNDQIPHGIAAELADGTVTMESVLESVRRTSSGTYELRFSSSPEPVAADRVVIAVPFSVLADVDLTDAGFSDQKLAAIDQLGMGTNSKVLIQLDRSYRDFDNWSGYIQRSDDPPFGTWESSSTDTAISNTSQPNISLLTVYAGGRAGRSYPTDQAHGVAPAAVAVKTLQALDEMVPGVAAAQTGDVWLDFWARDPWVRGSYAAFLPGNTTSFLGAMGDIEGSVHFAGEHTSVYSQGYLNGGAESGSRVAAEILDALDIAHPPGLTRAFAAQREYEPRYPW